MKILVVTQYFWPENFRINDLVEGLLERGHEITVLTGQPNYPAGHFAPGYSWKGPYRENWKGAEIVRVPHFLRGQAGSLRLAMNYFSFAISASFFGAFRCRKKRRKKYDAILVFEPSPATVGIPARLIGWIQNAPIFFWVQDLWPESLSATGAVTSSFILKSVAYLVRWIYHGCAKILIQSEAFYQPLKQLGVSSEKILYFPNTAEKIYQPISQSISATRTWQGPLLPRGFRIMFAGNLGTAQSLETILAAAELLRTKRDIHWIIIGAGRLKEWLEKEIVQRNLQHSVHLMGHFPVETMPHWFAQADVMLASLRRDPIFAMTIPSKIQSYMACAKPIIAAMDGEGARIVELSGSGYAVAAEDPAALAQAVQKIYGLTPAMRLAMGAHGRDYFEKHFCRAKLIDQLENWIAEFVRTK